MRSQPEDVQDRRIRPGKLRGVCKNKKTDRFEAHVWYKGKGYYLGSFQIRKLAAEAVDLAHLKLGRDQKFLNYGIERYEGLAQEIEQLPFLEVVELLRRQSCGFSRGSAKYRGVSKRAEDKWEARIGSFMGRSYTYLGTFATGPAAARAYDVVAVLTHGVKALTNNGCRTTNSWQSAYHHCPPTITCKHRNTFTRTHGRCGRQDVMRMPTSGSSRYLRCWSSVQHNQIQNQIAQNSKEWI